MSESGVTTAECPGRVDDVVRRVVREVERRGIEVLAVIDHSGDAYEAGLELPDTKLLVCGDLRVAAPLMRAHPLIGLDLPMRLLVTALDGERVIVACNSAEFLVERHDLTRLEAAALHDVEALVHTVVGR